MNHGLAIGYMAVAAIGVWLTAKHYRTRFLEFKEALQELSNYFRGRTRVEKLNLTYLYLTNKAKFDQVLKDEHDKYFDMFKDDNIWDYWYNTPLICYYLAENFQYLADPQYRQGNKKQVFVNNYDIKVSDIKSDLSHLPEDIRDNFMQGFQVSSYFLHRGIRFGDMFDYDKIKGHMTPVTASMCQTNDDEHYRLSAVKTFIEQVRTVHFLKKDDVGINTLSLEIKSQDPMMYYMIKFYYSIN